MKKCKPERSTKMAPVAQVGSTNSRLPSASRQANGASSHSSSDGAGSSSSTKNSFVQKYLNNCKSYYSCIHCRTHLANHDELVSRSFQGNRSRAYLFNTVVNISCGPAVQRELNTGHHAVADIFCTSCGTTMGWKYEKAYVENQKYKEGKYIIELAHVVRENRHLEFDKRDMFLGNQNHPRNTATNTATVNSGNSNHCGSLSSDYGHWSSSSSSPPPPPSSSSSNHEKREITHQIANLLRDYSGGGDYEQDEDDELMFSFYDDLCSPDRSSYPGFSSSRLRDSKMRRSIYLDSTPYDWKYSASTSDAASSPASPPSPLSSSAAAENLRVEASTMGSWLCYSDSVHSSSSSSSTSCPGEPEASSSCALKPGQPNNSNKQRTGDIGDRTKMMESAASNSMATGARQSTDSESRSRDDETQFNLESDLVLDDHDESSNAQPAVDRHGGVSSGGNDIAQHSCDRSELARYSPSTAGQGSSSTIAGSGETSKDNIQKSTSERLRDANSLSLDDEEFYDCCADHEVTNSNASPTRNPRPIPLRDQAKRRQQ